MKFTTDALGYTIGVMSRKTGVSIETIRYYERIAIMPKPDRTEGGNRQYNGKQPKRLFFIRRSRELGFRILEIRALLEMVDQDDFSCSEVHDLTVVHLVSVKKKIVSLKKLENVLSKMVAECNLGNVPDCPIVDTLFEVA
ncbi:MAG: helix-turn-helix domain-containing protein [Paracoccaceae bacterium]|jgi:MerR family mercuric resistance operon transcriptional regulator